MAFPVLTIGGEYFEEMGNLPTEFIPEWYVLWWKYWGSLLIKEDVLEECKDDVVHNVVIPFINDFRNNYDEARRVNSARFEQLDFQGMMLAQEKTYEDIFEEILYWPWCLLNIPDNDDMRLFAETNTMEEFVSRHMYSTPFQYNYIVFNGEPHEKWTKSKAEWDNYIVNNIFLKAQPTDIVSVVHCFE